MLDPTFFHSHIWDFEEIYNTFKEDDTNLDLMRLKIFPLTLKDKAKIWLNSLRLRTIRNGIEMQAEFLKLFFFHTQNQQSEEANIHFRSPLKRKILPMLGKILGNPQCLSSPWF